MDCSFLFFCWFYFDTEERFSTVSLNRMDRIRLIQSDDVVVGAVDSAVRQAWAPRGGIQEVSDKRPLCYELKLKGYPWWCDGNYCIFY